MCPDCFVAVRARSFLHFQWRICPVVFPKVRASQAVSSLPRAATAETTTAPASSGEQGSQQAAKVNREQASRGDEQVSLSSATVTAFAVHRHPQSRPTSNDDGDDGKHPRVPLEHRTRHPTPEP